MTSNGNGNNNGNNGDGNNGNNGNGNNNNGGERDIPGDIIEEILSRVSSIKELLVCRSVCRTWKTMIDKEDFRKKNFTEIKKCKLPTTLLIWIDSSIYSIDPTLDKLFPEIKKKKKKNISEHLINLDPFLYSPEMSALASGGERLHFKDFGTVNGLVCLGWGTRLHIIFNPSTKNYRIFTPPSIGWKFDIFDTKVEFIYAFGFDPVNQDYKFLMSCFQSPSNGALLNKTKVIYHLYSVNHNSWKWGVVDDFPYVRKIVTGDGHMDDGKFYSYVQYCGGNSYNPALVVFDFHKEEFHLIPLAPEFAGVHEAVVVASSGYLEMLVTFTQHHYQQDEYEDDEEEDGLGFDFDFEYEYECLRCQVWRQNNGEWTRKLEVTFPKEIGTPIGLTKEGKLVFASSAVTDTFNDFVLINPHTRSSIVIQLKATRIKVFNFVESFFS